MTVEDQTGGLVGHGVATDQFPVGMQVLAVDDDPVCLKVLELCFVDASISKRSEELARASREQVKVAGTQGSRAVLGSKGTSTVSHPFSAASSDSVIYMHEFDTWVATLNIASAVYHCYQAVMWFHLHEYTKAFSVLEPLYQNIGPMDDMMALHICLLFLDVGLACHGASKSADVLIYLEKAFGVSCASQGDNGSTTQPQSANLVPKSSSLPSNSLSTDASNSDLAANVNPLVKPLSRTLSDETLEYDSVFLDMDVAQQYMA